MKTGDKVYCKKNHIVMGRIYLEGEWYEIKINKILEDTIWVWCEDKKKGHRFHKKRSDYFRDYFWTEKEYRREKLMRLENA